MVGAGWTGNIQPLKQTSTAQDSQSISLTDPKLGITVDLLALATKQKMNTDVRRAVFCILMSSEDFVDAITKLVALGLKNKTKDVVYHIVAFVIYYHYLIFCCDVTFTLLIYVLMHCCQQEKAFNRFYAQVASRLCIQYNEFKFSLQVGFYQKLKVIIFFLSS